MRLKKGDWLVLGAVFVAWVTLALRFIPAPAGEVEAVIAVDGVVTRRVLLTGAEARVIDARSERGVRVEIEPGRIRFLASDCPDQVCVKSGWLSKPGQAAACVPEGVVVTLKSANDADVRLR